MSIIDLALIALRNFNDPKCPDNELDREAAAKCIERVIKQAQRGSIQDVICLAQIFEKRI